MVKSSRPGALRHELNSQVTLLSSQFSNCVRLGGDGRQQSKSSNENQALNWDSSSSTLANASPDLDSAMSVTPTPTPTPNPNPAETQSGVQGSLPKFTALGFEVDLTGSQNSATPFLRIIPGVDPFALMTQCPPIPRAARDDILALKRKEDRFKKKRANRLRKHVVVSRLLHSARQRLLTDLSLMVPGSIEQIKSGNPSGTGELDWSVLRSWLEERPDLKAQMNLTSRALKLIATYKGPSVEARSLQSLKLLAIVLCRLESDTYTELCSFLFPEDNRFSLQGACSDL